MSYANGTQHYNLPQTQGSDKRDWFDTNEAFRNVDTDLYTAKQTAETTASSLVTTNENVTGVANRVTAVESSVQTLQGNLATTNENVATNSTAINGLQTTVADNKQDLEDMITAYDEATATASRRYEVGDYFRYNDVLYITTVVITQGSTIVPDVNCESTNVMTRVKLLENGSGPAKSIIDDTVTTTTKTWSSSKINTKLGTKADNSKVGDLTSLETTNKTDLVSAINEVLSQIGGNGMKVYHGKATLPSSANASVSVNISSLGLTSADDYYVIIDMDAAAHNAGSSNFWGFGGCYVDNVTATSFNIKRDIETSAATSVSYQVVYNA